MVLAPHKGIFKYKLLIYGINSAFESFQHQIEQVVSGCSRVKSINDNMIIWEKDLQEHDKKLQNLSSKLKKYKLKLNPKKCIFITDQVLFASHIFIVKQNYPRQQKDNCHSKNCGFNHVNYVNHYFPNFSATAEPLQQLTKKGVSFTWTTEL